MGILTITYNSMYVMKFLPFFKEIPRGVSVFSKVKDFCCECGIA